MGRTVHIGKLAVLGAGTIGTARLAVWVIGAADRPANAVKAAALVVLLHPREYEVVGVDGDGGVAIRRNTRISRGEAVNASDDFATAYFKVILEVIAEILD